MGCNLKLSPYEENAPPFPSFRLPEGGDGAAGFGGPLKFEADTPQDANVVSRHEPGRVWVGNAVYEHSLLVPWRGAIVDWPVARFQDLDAVHFDTIAGLQPEVVVFGSGERLRFPAPALMRQLMAARIGVETMDTAAACRTYNVLASEGRRVLAALLIEAPPHSGVSR